MGASVCVVVGGGGGRSSEFLKPPVKISCGCSFFFFFVLYGTHYCEHCFQVSPHWHERGRGRGRREGGCLLKGKLISLCTLPIPPKVINC